MCNYYLPKHLNLYVGSKDLSDNISSFHLSCYSIDSKINDIHILLKSLSFNFDYIIFTETWLTDKNSSLFKNLSPGNNCFKKCRDSTTQGGGTAAFINTSSTAYVAKISERFWFEHQELNSNSLSDTNILLSVVYRPPNIPLTTFVPNFSNYLDELELHVDRNTHLYYLLIIMSISCILTHNLGFLLSWIIYIHIIYIPVFCILHASLFIQLYWLIISFITSFIFPLASFIVIYQTICLYL